VASISWGDLATAWKSTGVASITTYSALPRRLVRALRLARPLVPWVRRGPLRQTLAWAIRRGAAGPSAEVRERVRTWIWGRVEGANGAAAEGFFSTPEGYRLTAIAAIESLRRVAAGGVPTGALTPGLAFGPDFVHALPGVDRRTIRISP
jgi:saccharopine dehydrogenase (NAD+, L-lysine-forming)